MSVNFAFLDSGTGGLPYLKYLKAERPDSACVYVGDTKNFPYGEKTAGQIIEKSCGCAEKIIKKWNPDAVVVACNTISVSALDELRRRFPGTPFVGTVPVRQYFCGQNGLVRAGGVIYHAVQFYRIGNGQATLFKGQKMNFAAFVLSKSVRQNA